MPPLVSTSRPTSLGPIVARIFFGARGSAMTVRLKTDFPKPGESAQRTCLAGEGVHGPADADAHQEKKEKGPQNVLDAIERAAAAEKSEGHGNHQREKQHGLKMIQVNAHRASALAPARCFVGVQGGEQVQDAGGGEEARAVVAARA